jgi:hypothetical protein
VPKLRVGRDTDYVIDSIEGTDVGVKGTAADAVDRLVVDAAGIADPTGSGQVSAEMILPTTAAGHAILTTGYESLAEISEVGLVQQRAATLLTLRSAPNEQVGVRPRGTRELVDTFPLTGALARFDWRPGDGVRVRLPEVRIDDAAPRQITKPTFSLVPDGLAGVTASFRDRPRTAREAMRRLGRRTSAQRRQYQGSLAVVQGTWARNGHTVTDLQYTRMPLPADLRQLVRLWLVVVLRNGVAGAGTIYVNGAATAEPVNGPDRYDLTRYAARHLGIGGLIYSHCTFPGADSAEYFLEAEIVV